ncbi:hypothetical protein Tco_0857999 [Tanacetum coccineum]|uniref:Uncharacterized protein n=1 Tax=Tanacetum coccineum TaxID=301880 RepID=A0ABQ5BAL6_9ASTR
MVAFLKKPQGSEDFYQIVDFLNGSYIRTLDNGEIKITATVDGQDKTITEASFRRHLKLADAYGISTLLTTEFFEQLALMGVADKAITKEMHDGLGRATITASSLEAEQGSGKVTTLENELINTKAIHNKALITLTKRVKKLEKKLKLKRRSAVVDSTEDEEAREAHDTAGHRMESDDTKVVDFSTASPQNDDDEVTLVSEQVVKESSRKSKGRLKRKTSKARKDKDKR